jgi:hypothetical protein
MRSYACCLLQNSRTSRRISSPPKAASGKSSVRNFITVKPMGWVSYLEDINERRHENLVAQATFEYRVAPRPVIILAASPPLQPRMPSPVDAPPVQADAEAIAKRTSELNQKHVLALLELRPGNRWRH